MPWVETGCYYRSTFIFFPNLHTDFHGGGTNLYSQRQCAGTLPHTLTRVSAAIYLPDGTWNLVLCNCVYFMTKNVVQFHLYINWSYVLLLKALTVWEMIYMWGYTCHSTYLSVRGDRHEYVLFSLWQVLRQITGPLALLLELLFFWYALLYVIVYVGIKPVLGES